MISYSMYVHMLTDLVAAFTVYECVDKYIWFSHKLYILSVYTLFSVIIRKYMFLLWLSGACLIFIIYF